MWFKNIQIYKLNNKKNIDINQLEAQLKEETFTPCSEYDLFQTGWVQVLKSDESLFQKVNDCYFIKLRTEKKNIPSSVVKEELEARIAKYAEENEGKRPNKDQKNEFKEAIIMNLASKAFVSSTFIDAYIDLKRDIIVVNTGSTKTAEELLGMLRETLGSLEVSLLEPTEDVSMTLSSWITNHNTPKMFDIGMSVDFKDLDGGSISVKKHDVEVDEIKTHIENGKNVVKLELIWMKRIRFTLTNKFEIKGLKPEDIIKEEVQENLGDSVDEYNEFQSNMIMMVEDFAEIIGDLSNNM